MLLQVLEQANKEPVLQPIAFWSQKFSEQASKWPTIEKEGYGIYAAVKKFSYYLVGKHFIVETDHNNLKWMEASLVPKIVRWRIYLQSFSFQIRHIKGTANTLADGLSRLLLMSHHPVNQSKDLLQDLENVITKQATMQRLSPAQRTLLSDLFDVDEIADEDMDMNGGSQCHPKQY